MLRCTTVLDFGIESSCSYRQQFSEKVVDCISRELLRFEHDSIHWCVFQGVILVKLNVACDHL